MKREAIWPIKFPVSDRLVRTFSPAISAHGTIWLSGSTAVKIDAVSGRGTVDGDLVSQATVILEKFRLTLEGAGLDLGDIVSIVQYLSPEALPDFQKLQDVYAKTFSGRMPVINTVIVKRMIRRRALIEIESVARRDKAGEPMFLPGVGGADLEGARRAASELLARSNLDWGDVVRATELVSPATFAANPFLAPQAPGLQVVAPQMLEPKDGAHIHVTVAKKLKPQIICLSAEGDPDAGDIVAQCADIYRRLAGRLLEAGSSLQSVVKTTEFLTSDGLEAYGRTADIRREIFTPPFPVATGVICERLKNSKAQIAVDVIAMVET